MVALSMANFFLSGFHKILTSFFDWAALCLAHRVSLVLYIAESALLCSWFEL